MRAELKRPGTVRIVEEQHSLSFSDLGCQREIHAMIEGPFTNITLHISVGI